MILAYGIYRLFSDFFLLIVLSLMVIFFVLLEVLDYSYMEQNPSCQLSFK
jgi:hypothetical protein